MVLEIAISSRRSRAVGWRRAMIVDRSRSISISIALTRSSVASTWVAMSPLKVRQRVHGLRDLRLDHAAHLEHARGDAAQLGVELGGQMFVGHDLLSGRRGNRLHGSFTRICR